jgi:Uma2 family endonuclease
LPSITLLEDQIEVPPLTSLREFRDWALSDDFPETGRIDFIRGRIEVDMSPEDLFTHGTLKVKLISALDGLVEEIDYGILFSDRSRVSNEAADFSAEPDIVIVSHDAVDKGRVRWVPKASKKKGRYVEIEGTPDIVIEIVSDSSEDKDSGRLPAAYYDAGIFEYWLIDSRGDELLFDLQVRGEGGYVPVEPDTDGWRVSAALGKRFYLDRRWHAREYWVYRLLVSDAAD